MDLDLGCLGSGHARSGSARSRRRLAASSKVILADVISTSNSLSPPLAWR
jgi:hypothetical protein